MVAMSVLGVPEQEATLTVPAEDTFHRSQLRRTLLD